MARRSDIQDTRDLIRNHAIKLFQENGFDNVTVMQICEAAGVTKRTFYYHYKSKDELLYGLTNYMGVLAEELLDTMAEQQTNIGMLWTLMSVYSINCTKLGSSLVRQIYIHNIRGETEEDFPYSTYLYNTVIRTIRNAKAAGEIQNPSTAEDLAFTLYHAFRSVTVTWAAADGKTDLNEGFRQVFATALGIARDSF